MHPYTHSCITLITELY